MSMQDIARSAKMFSDLAAQLDSANRAFRDIGEDVQHQADLFASFVTPDIIASVEKTARMYEESIASVAEAAAARLAVEQSAFAESAKMVAALQPTLPDLIASYPKLVDFVGHALPTIEDFAPMLEGIAKIHIPDGILAPGFVDSLRDAALAQISDVEGSEHEALAQMVQSLADIEQAADQRLARQVKEPVPSDSRSNVLLILAVLSVLFQFLASQREILETGFEDAAAAGAALTHVFPYAAAILVFVIAYRSIKGD